MSTVDAHLPAPGEASRKLLPASDLIERAHKIGLLVHTWTFRNEQRRLVSDYAGNPVNEYLQFYRLGIDGVFSDFADTAVAARVLFDLETNPDGSRCLTRSRGGTSPCRPTGDRRLLLTEGRCLGLAFFRQLLEQLFRQDLSWYSADLGTLAAQAGGYSQDPACDPEGSPMQLAVDLAGYRIARRIPVHTVRPVQCENVTAMDTAVRSVSRMRRSNSAWFAAAARYSSSWGW